MGYKVVIKSGLDRITKHYPSKISILDGDLLRVKWQDGGVEIINIRDPNILSLRSEDDAPDGMRFRDVVEHRYFNKSKGGE